MKYVKSTILAASLFTASAHAEPVYLSCTVSDGNNSNEIEMTLDESHQRVSYTIMSTGFTQTLTGAFTVDRILFVSRPGELAEMQYEISREDLSISRSLPNANDHRESGTCTVVKASQNRKI